ncbi:CPBP family intramembrane glutamic endopeptidase [Bombilactobacillus bombi]|uniref:CPBP family intramembrane glutamic endopeptidase n=1 Tax=Bombilactobacillus bombi TaxID=1303590 RepID=UPI0015E609F2|nr:type II CAAX endopeptidase family protein [Bombilactobacillus bombi]MBA1433985.1 CPBP family intramembrane metalloprotease [Bombilactobacillus bombi]
MSNLRKILNLIGYFIGYQCFVSIIFIGLYFPHQIKIWATIIFAIIGCLLSGKYLWWLINKYRSQQDLKFNLPRFSTIKVLIIAVIIISLIQYLTNFIPEPTNQKELDKLIQANIPLFSLSTVILAPLYEELIFRGFLAKYFFPNFKNGKNVILYAVISGVLFGFAHEPVLDAAFLLYSSIGIVLAMTYVNCRDLRYNIGLHMLMNLVATGIMILNMNI